MKQRLLWLLGGMFVLLQVSVGAALAYNVTGSIQNVTGNSTKRVYVVLLNSDGTNSAGFGTSIASIPNGTSTDFTIRGVPSGSYQLAAFMDLNDTGSLNFNEPANVTDSFSLSGDHPVGTIPLAAVSPLTPPPVDEVNVVTTSNGALVVWDGPKSSYGGGGPDAERADSYVIYWGTAPKPGDGGASLGSKTVPAAGSDYHVFVSGLSPGASLYFGVKSVINGSGTYAYNSSGPYPIAAQAGAVTVSGRVYSTGISKVGKPLYIALQGNNGGFYIGLVPAPVGDTATWTITGVQPDTYSIYVILDLNNDGFSNVAGYATGRGMSGNLAAPSITVPSGATAATAPDVTLTAPSSKTTVTTMNNGNSSYMLQFSSYCGTRRPVSVTVNSGPNLGGPMDLGISLGNGNGASFGDSGPQVYLATAPVLGDTYSVTVNYATGSPETLSPKVTGVVTDFPSLVFPDGNTSPIYSNSSLFAWNTPTPLPAGYYDYYLWMNSDGSFNRFWYPQDNGNGNMPATQLSLPFNADGSAQQSTLTSGTYNWGISVNDAYGNSGWGFGNTITPQGSGPVISGFNPTTGAAGTSVTISGSGFTGATAVSFGGVSATSVTVNSGSQITATVPTGAPVGPITVTSAGGVTGGSSSPFQATVIFTGGVANAGGTAINGATVTYVNNPLVSATTNSSGVFTITIPSGVPYSLLIHDGVHFDTQTQIMMNRTNSNASSSPYKLYANGDITPYSVASKGLIYTTVKNWDTGDAIQGATLTATSFQHPDTPYTVSYTGGASATGSDGVFYVPNVDEGDVVTVQGVLAGYYLQPKTYVTHTGVVSAGKVNATPLPVVTATPSGGTISSSQAIALSVSNPVGGNSYSIYYTTDGSDPTTSGSKQTYSGQFTLNVGSVTLKYYALNTTRNVAGSVGTATYNVYTSSPPEITGFSPQQGKVGDQVTITGSNFFSDPSSNVVTFNGVQAAVTSANSSQLVVTVPAGATTGPITVTTASGSDDSAGNFTVQYTLTAAKAGTGDGSVLIDPPGDIYVPTSPILYDYNTAVTLTAVPDSNSLLSWSGCDSAVGTTCNVTMTTDKSVTATFTYVSPVQLNGVDKPSLQAAFNEATNGCVIKARAHDFNESSLNLNTNPNYTVSLKGGYDQTYTSNSGYSNLLGVFTVTSGILTIENFVIQ